MSQGLISWLGRWIRGLIPLEISWGEPLLLLTSQASINWQCQTINWFINWSRPASQPKSCGWFQLTLSVGEIICIVIWGVHQHGVFRLCSRVSTYAYKVSDLQERLRSIEGFPPRHKLAVCMLHHGFALITTYVKMLLNLQQGWSTWATSLLLPCSSIKSLWICNANSEHSQVDGDYNWKNRSSLKQSNQCQWKVKWNR